MGLLAPVFDPHRRRSGAHRLPDLPALPAARQRRRPADDRPWPVAALRRWCGRQAGDGLGRQRLGVVPSVVLTEVATTLLVLAAPASIAGFRAGAAARRWPDAERHVFGALRHRPGIREPREAHARLCDLLHRRLGGGCHRSAAVRPAGRRGGPGDGSRCRRLSSPSPPCRWCGPCGPPSATARRRSRPAPSAGA